MASTDTEIGKRCAMNRNAKIRYAASVWISEVSAVCTPLPSQLKDLGLGYNLSEMQAQEAIQEIINRSHNLPDRFLRLDNPPELKEINR